MQNWRGDAARQTNGTGGTTAYRAYDAFGVRTINLLTPVGPFGYAAGHGYQGDEDSGLMLLGHRYYDPSTGRFLTRDPIRNGRNWYGYCENNPLKGIDPSGLDWRHEPIGGDVRNGGKKPIIIIGEPGPGQPRKAIIIKPGETDPPGFDTDEVGYQDDKGVWHWSHVEILFPYTTGSDVIITPGGTPYVGNGKGHLVPLPAGSAPYEEFEKMRKGAKPGGGHGSYGPPRRTHGDDIFGWLIEAWTDAKKKLRNPRAHL